MAWQVSRKSSPQRVYQKELSLLSQIPKGKRKFIKIKAKKEEGKEQKAKLKHIEAYLGINEAYSEIFRTLYNPYIHNRTIFRALTDLEPKATSKACKICKMRRHIQSSSIVRTDYSSISRIFGDIQGY